MDTRAQPSPRLAPLGSGRRGRPRHQAPHRSRREQGRRLPVPAWRTPPKARCFSASKSGSLQPCGNTGRARSSPRPSASRSTSRSPRRRRRTTSPTGLFEKLRPQRALHDRLLQALKLVSNCSGVAFTSSSSSSGLISSAGVSGPYPVMSRGRAPSSSEGHEGEQRHDRRCGIINAPSSTKNASASATRRCIRRRKASRKGHFGVEKEYKLIHAVAASRSCFTGEKHMSGATAPTPGKPR